MKWFNSFNVPVNKDVELRFEQAVVRLEKKLMKINVDDLDVSEYSKKYFKDYQNKLKYSLQACAFILMHAGQKSGISMEQTVIVDYGAGTGVLAMLAKEVGFGKVIYNDIYEVSCHDAKIIATIANSVADEYVCGEVKALQLYFEKTNSTCNIIVSRNVIEHVYNLESYFKELRNIPHRELTLFFATTANYHNPLTVLYTNKIQRMLEFKGMTTKWGKERDTLQPYLITRRKIIESAHTELNNQEINQLAEVTRGLIKEDIHKVVAQYKQTGKIPNANVGGYNTCDPNTGNWAEHLVPLAAYKLLFEKNGFRFELQNGFYNTHYNKKWLNLITPAINFIIRKLGAKGIYFAPFIGLEGK